MQREVFENRLTWERTEGTEKDWLKEKSKEPVPRAVRKMLRARGARCAVERKKAPSITASEGENLIPWRG